VNTIITLATPHEDPIISVDYALRRFYSKFATHRCSKAKNLNGLIVASIGGGLRDFQVRSGLTHTDVDGLSVLVHIFYLSLSLFLPLFSLSFYSYLSVVLSLSLFFFTSNF